MLCQEMLDFTAFEFFFCGKLLESVKTQLFDVILHALSQRCRSVNEISCSMHMHQRWLPLDTTCYSDEVIIHLSVGRNKIIV